MASNQAKIGCFIRFPERDQEEIGIPTRAKAMALKSGLAFLIILARAFIALPVAYLFIKSPLDTTLKSLHDPIVMDA